MTTDATMTMLAIIKSQGDRLLRLEAALRDANISIPSTETAKAKAKARFERLNPTKRYPVVKLR